MEVGLMPRYLARRAERMDSTTQELHDSVENLLDDLDGITANGGRVTAIITNTELSDQEINDVEEFLSTPVDLEAE